MQRLLFSRRTLLGGAAAVASASATRAQNYPSQPIRLIVNVPPGGVTDTLARLLAQYLGARWGNAFIVDNRAGGNSAIAAHAVMFFILFSQFYIQAYIRPKKPEKLKV